MDGFFDQYRSIRFGPITVQNIFCQKETEKTEQNNYQTVIHRSQPFLNRSNCFLTVHRHLQPLIKKRNGTTIKTVNFNKFYSKLFDYLGPKSKLNWRKLNFTDINDCLRLSVLYRVVYFLVWVFILTQKFWVLCTATPPKLRSCLLEMPMIPASRAEKRYPLTHSSSVVHLNGADALEGDLHGITSGSAAATSGDFVVWKSHNYDCVPRMLRQLKLLIDESTLRVYDNTLKRRCL